MNKQDLKDFVNLNNKIFKMVLDINDQLAEKERETRNVYMKEVGNYMFKYGTLNYFHSEKLEESFHLYSDKLDKGRMYFDNEYLILTVGAYDLAIPYEIIEFYDDKEVLTYLIDEKVRNEYKFKYENYLQNKERERIAKESERRILTQRQLEQEIFNDLKAKHGDKLLSMLKKLEKEDV